jgi:hypothetical protein
MGQDLYSFEETLKLLFGIMKLEILANRAGAVLEERR